MQAQVTDLKRIILMLKNQESKIVGSNLTLKNEIKKLRAQQKSDKHLNDMIESLKANVKEKESAFEKLKSEVESLKA